MKCGTCGHPDEKHGAPFSTDATCQVEGCECFGFEAGLSGEPVVDDERVRQLRGYIREAKDDNWEDLDFCLWELQEFRKGCKCKRTCTTREDDDWNDIPY